MDLKLTNKVALVTGSTAGIGFAIARQLVGEGAHVYLNGRTQERVDADLLPESIRGKEIVRGVRLQLSEFLPPLPGEPGSRDSADSSQPSLFQIMDEIERRIIMDMLERTGWNQTEAAERFLIPLSTLNQKIKRLGIDVRRRGRNEDSLSAFTAK